MNLFSNTITGANFELIKTEILFFIAEAKTIGADLIKLYAEETKINTASRILRSAKRNGMIQLFVYSGDFDKKTTEVEYLTNKYPNTVEIDSGDFFFLIKT